jgi:hypothetical protein
MRTTCFMMRAPPIQEFLPASPCPTSADSDLPLKTTHAGVEKSCRCCVHRFVEFTQKLPRAAPEGGVKCRGGSNHDYLHFDDYIDINVFKG